MHRNIFALTDQTPRGLSNYGGRHTTVRLLSVDAPGSGGGGGGVPAAAPASPAAAAPASPAATPAADSVIAQVAAPAAVSADDQRKYLTEKGGKAEDLAKLTEADLKKQYDDAKAKEAAPAAPVKAEDIKITVPEGIVVDEKLMGDFKGLIADANLTPTERAQKLVDLHVGALKSEVEKTHQTWRDTQTKWQGEIKADKELGGANFDTVKATISKAVTEVGGPEAKAAFEAFAYTGAGNHPAIVRLMYRMGKALTEGGPIGGRAPAEAKGRDLASALNAMYPSANQTGAAKAA